LEKQAYPLRIGAEYLLKGATRCIMNSRSNTKDLDFLGLSPNIRVKEGSTFECTRRLRMVFDSLSVLSDEKSTAFSLSFWKNVDDLVGNSQGFQVFTNQI